MSGDTSKRIKDWRTTAPAIIAAAAMIAKAFFPEYAAKFDVIAGAAVTVLGVNATST